MIWLALGLVVLGLILGTTGMRRLGRLAGRTWRPQAGVLAMACFVGAAAMGVREQWGGAILLLILGIFMALGVRRAAREPHRRQPPAQRPGRMTREEARSILGVGPDATAEEVQAAYVRLIRRTHPDQGGTTGLAAQLNAARDVLLGKD